MKIVSFAILALLIGGLIVVGAAENCENPDKDCLTNIIAAADYETTDKKCWPWIIASDAEGNPKDLFMVGEDMYCYGKRFIPLIPVRIYVVDYQETWNPCDPLNDVSGGYEQVNPDCCGKFDNTLIWESISAEGTYEVVLDTNFDSKWNIWEPRDIVTVESNTIPEFSTIAIPAALVLGIVFVLSYRKRNRK